MNIRLFTYPLNGLLMIAIPVGLAVFLVRRFGRGWRLIAIGAATFVLSQALHIPFNNYLLQPWLRGFLLADLSQKQSLVATGVLLGLSAGIFEEIARYLVYRWWAKDARSWSKGVLLGAGHGGIEAVLFGILALLSFVNLLVLRNMDLTTVVPAEQVETLRRALDTYWSSPIYLSLFGALERALTIPIQITFSILVLQSFLRRNPAWLGLAVLWHTLVDAAVVIASSIWGIVATEGLLAIATVLSVVMLFALRKPEPEAEPELPPAPIEPLDLESIRRSPENDSLRNLDETRYSGR